MMQIRWIFIACLIAAAVATNKREFQAVSQWEEGQQRESDHKYLLKRNWHSEDAWLARPIAWWCGNWPCLSIIYLTKHFNYPNEFVVAVGHRGLNNWGSTVLHLYKSCFKVWIKVPLIRRDISNVSYNQPGLWVHNLMFSSDWLRLQSCSMLITVHIQSSLS